MNILIVYCHPEPTSFNGSLKEVAVKTFERRGDSVEVSDLYGEKFNPVEMPENYKNRAIPERFDALSEQRNSYKKGELPYEIKREIDRLENCDLLILQFPMWWHQQPAMLKGWFDRVFVSGGLYTSKMRYDRGYFRGKKAICSVTSGAPISTFTDNGRGGGEIDTLLRSINFSLYYMGFTVLPSFLSAEIQNKGFTYMSESEFQLHLEKSLDAWEKHLKGLDDVRPLEFSGWCDWDEKGVDITA